MPWRSQARWTTNIHTVPRKLWQEDAGNIRWKRWRIGRRDGPLGDKLASTQGLHDGNIIPIDGGLLRCKKATAGRCQPVSYPR